MKFGWIYWNLIFYWCDAIWAFYETFSCGAASPKCHTPRWPDKRNFRKTAPYKTRAGFYGISGEKKNSVVNGLKESHPIYNTRQWMINFLYIRILWSNQGDNFIVRSKMARPHLKRKSLSSISEQEVIEYNGSTHGMYWYSICVLSYFKITEFWNIKTRKL